MADALLESILRLLEPSTKAVNSLEIAAQLKEDHQKIVGAIMSLQSLGELINAEQVSTKRWELTKEGQGIVDHGSHEARVFQAIPADGIEQPLLMKAFDDPTVAKLGFSKAMSAGWIKLDPKPIVKRKVDSIEDSVQKLLIQLRDLKLDDVPEKEKQDLKKRKLAIESVIKSFDLTKGPGFTLTIEKPETELTSEMIAKGTWKTKNFKDYNFAAKGAPIERGHLHPLLKVREQFRQIFLEMGFEEMPTNNYVESSFWNFDALFQPQQHPARDAHDTFFLSDPSVTETSRIPADYLELVKKTHSVGGFGSQGYNYDWKVEEAQKNLLRTHTTAVSARMLYKAAQEYKANGSKEWTPIKYFSIDRVFRNETLDATHLAEFQQIEGVVANVGLTLGDLCGVIKAFFLKLGIKDIKFKPAYNPYTEPSMEIFGFHTGLNKWVELGNSGMFRPEMLLPMGLPENVSVIAWGLSLERPTMIKYGINNIRDLVGHKVNLQMVYDNPVCILDEVKG